MILDGIQPIVSVAAGVSSGLAYPAIGVADPANDGATLDAVRAGPARPVYLVTAADLAAGRFRLQSGPPIRVIIPLDTRTVEARGAMPIYIQSGSASILYKLRNAAISPTTCIGFWPLDDTSGTTALDASGNARNGAYTGTYTLNQAGLGDGQGALGMTAGNVNLGSSGIPAAFNGNEVTISGWAKVSALADWSDATARYLAFVGVDGSNQVYVRKATTSNQLQFIHLGAGTSKVVLFTMNPTDWFHWAITASAGAAEIKGYINGVQVAATAASPGTYTGTPSATLTALGASSSSSASPWKGTKALDRIDNAALSPTNIARLAQCRGIVVFDGDSRFVGGSQPAPQQCMQNATMLTLRYGMANIATSGETWTDMGNGVVAQAGVCFRRIWRNVIVGWAGVNDANAGANAATIWSRMQTWAALARGMGFVVILCTEIDGQSASLNSAGWHTTIMPQLNTSIRNGWRSIADNIADLGSDARLQDATNTTYFNADKVHLTDTGYGIVGTIVAGAVVAAVSTQ